MAELKVTQEAWDKLSSEEKKIAKGLGIIVKGKKEAKVKEAKKRLPELQGYYLETRTTCELCGTVHSKHFYMADSGQGYLESKAMDLAEPFPEIHPLKEMSVKHCNDCFWQLRAFSKEELIEKLINTVTNKGGNK